MYRNDLFKIRKHRNKRRSFACFVAIEQWDNTPLFVKYNPGFLDLLILLDETSCTSKKLIALFVNWSSFLIKNKQNQKSEM
jgi:hypothetical protein